MPRKHAILSLALVAIALVLSANPAAATPAWCHRDPVFLVAGTQVSVDLAVYEDQQAKVTGPAQVTLYVPPGVTAKLVYTDKGFNGRGEATSIQVDKRLI